MPVIHKEAGNGMNPAVGRNEIEPLLSDQLTLGAD